MSEQDPVEPPSLERRKGGRRQTDLDGAFNDGYKLSSVGGEKTWIGWCLWTWRTLAVIVGSWVIVVAIFHAIFSVVARLRSM